MDLKNYIRSRPNYPKKGILFRDITTLIKDETAFSETIEELEKFYSQSRSDLEKMMNEWEEILINLKNFKKY